MVDRWNKAGHKEIRDTKLKKSTKSWSMGGGVSMAEKTLKELLSQREEIIFWINLQIFKTNLLFDKLIYKENYMFKLFYYVNCKCIKK